MSTITTIAIIGATGSRGFSLAKLIAARYRVLLFDKDEEKLSAACHQILATNPSANAEAMVCPTDASWEADIILVSGYCRTDNEIAGKIRKASTGKIVIIISDDINNDIFSNPTGNLQQLLLHSKVIQVFNATGQSATYVDKELIIEGNDEEALATVASIFTSIGFNTVISVTNAIINKNFAK